MASQEEQINYWVFKSVSDEDRSYQNMAPYDDELSSRYEYDSNVPNNKQVKKGDLAVLIDKSKILGFARIGSIDSAPGEKKIDRCPVCQTTSFEPRKNKTPTFRCNKKHEFQTPISTMEKVIQYKAHYRNSFEEPAEGTQSSEGCGRSSKKDTVHFLFMARGLCMNWKHRLTFLSISNTLPGNN